MKEKDIASIDMMVETYFRGLYKEIFKIATHVRLIGSYEESRLREIRRIDYNFTKKTLLKLKIEGGDFLKEPKKKKFQEMISKHNKAFASSSNEIGCINLKFIVPIVIFTISNIPWDLKPIYVPKALLPKLMSFIEYIYIYILKLSMAL